MQVLDTLRGAQDGAAVANLARTFGITPRQAEAVLAAVVPQLSSAIDRNTLSRGGLADLVRALGQGHHEQVLDNPAYLGNAAVRADGEAVLGHILGSKDRSRSVAERAALSSGVSATLIKLMLPYIASWLMGGLSKQMKGGLGDILGRLPGGGGGIPGGQMPELPRMPGGGGIAMPRFPSPGEHAPPQSGNPLPWPTTGGRMEETAPTTVPRGNSPLPLPGDTFPGMPGDGRNPYGDLSDILRRGMGLPGGGNQGGGIQIPVPMPQGGGGGTSLPGGAVGGGLLWRIVRGLLGNALGFQGGGLMSWLFRMIVLKFGWSLLRRLLGGR
jgi:hypothetical protein